MFFLKIKQSYWYFLSHIISDKELILIFQHQYQLSETVPLWDPDSWAVWPQLSVWEHHPWEPFHLWGLLASRQVVLGSLQSDPRLAFISCRWATRTLQTVRCSDEQSSDLISDFWHLKRGRVVQAFYFLLYIFLKIICSIFTGLYIDKSHFQELKLLLWIDDFWF